MIPESAFWRAICNRGRRPRQPSAGAAQFRHLRTSFRCIYDRIVVRPFTSFLRVSEGMRAVEHSLISVFRINDDFQHVSVGIARCKSLFFSAIAWGVLATLLAAPIVALLLLANWMAPNGVFDPNHNVVAWAILVGASLAPICAEVGLMTRVLRNAERSYGRELTKAVRHQEKSLLREIDREIDALFADDAL